MGITQADLDDIITNISTINISGASGAIAADIDLLTTAIQDLANLRATNGSEQSRLTLRLLV